MSRLYILQAEYCNADRTTWKLTLQDINTTPKELKTERDCSHRQLFRYNQLSSHVDFSLICKCRSESVFMQAFDLRIFSV